MSRRRLGERRPGRRHFLQVTSAALGWWTGSGQRLARSVLSHFRDVVVAAFRSPTEASAALIDRVVRREFTMLLSVPLVLEYETGMW